MPQTQTTVYESPNLESSISAVSGSAIISGAIAAISISTVLALVGSGLGFSMLSPWGDSATATTLTASAIIWLIIMQWFSAGMGGYIAGRLRTKWAITNTDEVFFRDTAHGFLAWALSTVVMALFFTSAASILVASVQKDNVVTSAENTSSDYYVDTLFRTNGRGAANFTEDRNKEVVRIFGKSMRDGEISSSDRAYLAQRVSAETGLSQGEAEARVDNVLSNIKTAADKARKTAASVSLFMALSMLIGAFIASVAGVIGGRARDEY